MLRSASPSAHPTRVRSKARSSPSRSRTCSGSSRRARTGRFRPRSCATAGRSPRCGRASYPPRRRTGTTRCNSSDSRPGSTRFACAWAASSRERVCSTARTNGTDIVFAHGDDGSLAFAYLPYSFRQPGNPAAGYVHTDRPIYRPGDRVQYRALVRDGIPGSYAVPAGEVSLVIRDPEWKNVVTAKVRLDAFGALAGDLPLADDAKLGTYQIGVTGASTYYIATTSFAVEAYKKPEYVIDVAAPRYVDHVLGLLVRLDGEGRRC